MRVLHILHSLRPRLPRAKTFLGFIPLQMGTELISGVLFFNKLTGAYGLLAILTGFSLSLLQLSAYVYNFGILVLLAICIPHIRRETPLPNLALAWAYTIDTVINAAYTASFAISWYLSLTAAASTSSTPASSAVPAAASSSVAAAVVAASNVASLRFRDDADSEATLAEGGSPVAQSPSSSSSVSTAGAGWMSVHEATASLTLIAIVTLVRFYFCLVVISHTRQALQRYGDHVVESATAADANIDDDDDDYNNNGGEGSQTGMSADGRDISDEEAGLKSSGQRSARRHHRRQRLQPPTYPPHHPAQQRASTVNLTSASSSNPFAAGSPAGEGWKGKLGRTLLGLGGPSFWLGRVKDDDWTRDVNSRFRS